MRNRNPILSELRERRQENRRLSKVSHSDIETININRWQNKSSVPLSARPQLRIEDNRWIKEAKIAQNHNEIVKFLSLDVLEQHDWRLTKEIFDIFSPVIRNVATEQEKQILEKWFETPGNYIPDRMWVHELFRGVKLQRLGLGHWVQALPDQPDFGVDYPGGFAVFQEYNQHSDVIWQPNLQDAHDVLPLFKTRELQRVAISKALLFAKTREAKSYLSWMTIAQRQYYVEQTHDVLLASQLLSSNSTQYAIRVNNKEQLERLQNAVSVLIPSWFLGSNHTYPDLYMHLVLSILLLWTQKIQPWDKESSLPLPAIIITAPTEDTSGQYCVQFNGQNLCTPQHSLVHVIQQIMNTENSLIAKYVVKLATHWLTKMETLMFRNASFNVQTKQMYKCMPIFNEAVQHSSTLL